MQKFYIRIERQKALGTTPADGRPVILSQHYGMDTFGLVLGRDTKLLAAFRCRRRATGHTS